MWPKMPDSHSFMPDPTLPDASENNANIKNAPTAMMTIDAISSLILDLSSEAALPRASDVTFFFAPEELRFFAVLPLFFRFCGINSLTLLYSCF